MKKSKVLLLWITFIILVNLAFLAYFVAKSTVLTVLLGALTIFALIAAIVYHIRFTFALKKQAKARKEYAKKAAAEWQAKAK